MVRVAFTEAAEQGAMHAGPDRSAAERIEVVAVSREPLVLSGDRLAKVAGKGGAQTVQVRLNAPRELARPREKGRLAPGRSNGWISLELKVEEG